MNTVINTLEAKARYEGESHEVYKRVARIDDKIYIDLCNAKWQAIAIDGQGWRIANEPPVRFYRKEGMLSLPIPQKGNLQLLRELINIRSEDDFVLIVSYLFVALGDPGSYFTLIVMGEQGTAKSSFSKLIRSLCDPNSAPLRSLSRNEQEIFISAHNSHLLVFDNVSHISNWLSDSLCRIATGGAFAARQLYSDTEETLLNEKAPVILNGISGNMATRGDLADRAICLTLDVIPEDKRRPEKELLEAFHKAQPAILGALCSGLSHGLKHEADTHITHLPRMADCAKWASACEGAFWEPGRFMQAYQANRLAQNDMVIEADSVAVALRNFMQGHDKWEGTATELLNALNKLNNDSDITPTNWPKTAKSLSERLTRNAPALRKAGICIDRDRKGAAGSRIIEIRASAASVKTDDTDATDAENAICTTLIS